MTVYIRVDTAEYNESARVILALEARHTGFAPSRQMLQRLLERLHSTRTKKSTLAPPWDTTPALVPSGTPKCVRAAVGSGDACSTLTDKHLHWNPPEARTPAFPSPAPKRVHAAVGSTEISSEVYSDKEIYPGTPTGRSILVLLPPPRNVSAAPPSTADVSTTPSGQKSLDNCVGTPVGIPVRRFTRAFPPPLRNASAPPSGALR
ncbi:hypothetical protein DFH09DRAFT_1108311 [Mycena vulgaris]|nr:hypothetical protein DFH09DRAFT_1108311 [Mycena vulgaris]